MNKEIRTVVYDDELRIEAYRFEGIVQPFPNHFHEYYVIGFMEKENAAFPVKIKSMSLRKAILSFSTLGTIIPASNSVLSAGSVEGMCQKLPGHVQDFHLRERAHGAHQKGRRISPTPSLLSGFIFSYL